MILVVPLTYTLSPFLMIVLWANLTPPVTWLKLNSGSLGSPTPAWAFIDIKVVVLTKSQARSNFLLGSPLVVIKSSAFVPNVTGTSFRYGLVGSTKNSMSSLKSSRWGTSKLASAYPRYGMSISPVLFKFSPVPRSLISRPFFLQNSAQIVDTSAPVSKRAWHLCPSMKMVPSFLLPTSRWIGSALWYLLSSNPLSLLTASFRACITRTWVSPFFGSIVVPAVTCGELMSDGLSSSLLVSLSLL